MRKFELTLGYGVKLNKRTVVFAKLNKMQLPKMFISNGSCNVTHAVSRREGPGILFIDSWPNSALLSVTNRQKDTFHIQLLQSYSEYILGILKKKCAKMKCHYNFQYTNIFFPVPCAFEININLHVYGKIHLCWLWPYHIIVYVMRHALLPYLLYWILTCRLACSVECHVILMSYFRRSRGLIRYLFTRLNIKAARSVTPKPTKAIHPRRNFRSRPINDVNTFYRVYSNGWSNFIMPYDNIFLLGISYMYRCWYSEYITLSMVSVIWKKIPAVFFV